MTKRDFFRIIIKLFALYQLIITIFYWIPSNYIYTIYGFELLPVIGLLVMTVLAFLFYILIIKYTDNILNFIKIDRGFDDEKFAFSNLKTKQILILGIVLLGGYLFITHLIEFLQYTFLAFRDQVSRKGGYLDIVFEFGSTEDYFNWFYSTANLILGYILLTNCKRIATWLDKKSTT
ncbi:hypothetical protein [Psychroserpens sp. MEBiC05023]